MEKIAFVERCFALSFRKILIRENEVGLLQLSCNP